MKPEIQFHGLFLPRTPSDFAKIDWLVARGDSNEEIIKKLKKEWRSEVIQLAGGVTVCRTCGTVVTPLVCEECGQQMESSYA